jgi:hypothetical protein
MVLFLQNLCRDWTSIVCWNLVHVAHLVNYKACTIIVPYCQDKERLPCLNIGVSYHSKIDAYERKGDCWYTHAQPAHFRVTWWLGHIVDIHFISHAWPLAAALRRPSTSACTATFLHEAVIRFLGSVTRDRLVDLQLLRRVRQLTAQELWVIS